MTTSDIRQGLPISPMLRVTQGRVIRSEWIKFRSLRSTVITLVVAVAITVGISLLVSALTGSGYDSASPANKRAFNAASVSVDGALFAQLAFGVLGVLVVTSEYSTGMIRATLTVVPSRLPVLWAKITVFSAIVGAIAIVTSLVSFFAGQAILSSYHLSVSLSSHDAFRIMIGSALYMTLIGIMGIAIGGLLRNTAGGISALVGLLFVIPPVLQLLPTSWTNDFGKYLPANAGQSLWVFHPHLTGGRMAPWAGFAVLCLWVFGFVILAAFRLIRSDA
jgi:ABC-2 type transport system permease protein